MMKVRLPKTTPRIAPTDSHVPFFPIDEFSETVIENSRDGIIGFDTECRLAVWNPAIEQISGLPAEVVLGRGLFEVLPFLKQTGEDEHISAALGGETVHTSERTYVISETGRTGFFEATYSPVSNAAGEIIGAIAIVHDTTEAKERQNAERRLEAEHRIAQVLAETLTLEEASSEILQALCSAVDGCIGEIWLVSENRDYLVCSASWIGRKTPEYCAFIAASRERQFETGEGLPGRCWAEGTAIFIADLPNNTNFPRAQLAAAAGLKSALAFPIANSTSFYGVIEFFSDKTFEPDPKLFQMMGAIGRDIAQFIRRRRAEAITKTLNQELEKRVAELTDEARAQLAAIVHSSSDAIIGKNLNGVITSWNNAAEQLFGYSAEEMIGQSVAKLVPTSHTCEDEMIFQRLKRGERVDPFETVRCTKDGRVRDVSLTVSPIRNRAGQLTGVSNTLRDITQNKRAEKFQKALSSLAHSLNSAATPREAARVIFETADELFQWDAFTLHLFAGDNVSVQRVMLIDTINGKRTEIQDDSPMTVTPRMRKVLNHGAQLILRNGGEMCDSQAFGDTTRVSASIMAVPIREGKTTIGVLSIHSYTQNRYDGEKLRTLQALADYCGGALERMRAMEQLLLREKQLRTITDSLPLLISFVDADQRYRFLNKTYEAWLGISAEDALGKRVKDVMRTSVYSEVQAHIEEALAGRAVSFERWLNDNNNSPRYTQALYLPVISNGVVQGFVNLTSDITERKLSEDRLHLLSEGTKVLSSSLHPDEMLTKLASLTVPTLADYCFFDVVDGSRIKRVACEHVSQEKKSWFANNGMFLPSQDFKAHPVIKVIASRKPQIITEVTDEWLQEVATSPQHLEYMRNLCCCSTMTLPVVFGDRIMGALTFCFSESNRQHSQEDCRLGEEIACRVAIALHNAELFESIKSENAKAQASETYFRDLAEAVPHMVWTTLPNGNFEYCNHRWCEYTGQTLEESQGLGWLDAVHAAHRDRVEAAWKKSLETGQLYQIEYPLRAAKGDYRWHIERALPLKGADGKITKWFGTCTDVHEKKEAEEMVCRMNQELERRVEERTSALKEINDQMESFCYSVSHDLRAPLRAMRAFTQVLLDDYAVQLDEAGQDFLHRVGNAAERMDRLINDLLDYSRLGRMELTLTDVGLESIMESVLLDLRLEVRAKKATVELKKPLPKVIAHETVLEQILQNLLSNALKFSKPDVAPEIEIWTEMHDNMIRLHVKDNGIGVPPEYHRRIFNVFERLHSSNEYPGTGIGLAIVHKAVERMNGRVGVESEAGHGSCFWIELPSAHDV